ncbi:hypothetical protein [Actinophytocola sp.]|uniref:hypothetical protein n=1 Tax=Actinophytocola sp. TaxID=1872138 RepID=UPI003D6C100F
MHIAEPQTLAELIADCAAIPVPPQPGDQAFHPLHCAEPWQVDDACYAQVGELDEYV